MNLINNYPYSIILASGSPRRAQLLQSLGFSFEVRNTNTDESFSSEMSVYEVPGFLAIKKALSFKGIISENELVITADTVVILNNSILNKPQNRDEAIQMLKSLSGTTNEVCTAVSILGTKVEKTFTDIAQVVFRELTDAEIEYYVDMHKPFDKAGAYGIQEWIGMIGIEKLNGSFYTVMGLPTHLLFKNLVEIANQ